MAAHLFHPGVMEGVSTFKHIYFFHLRLPFSRAVRSLPILSHRGTMGSGLTVKSGILKTGKKSPDHLEQLSHFMNGKTIIQIRLWEKKESYGLSRSHLIEQHPSYVERWFLVWISTSLSVERRLSCKLCSCLHKCSVCIW